MKIEQDKVLLLGISIGVIYVAAFLMFVEIDKKIAEGAKG